MDLRSHADSNRLPRKKDGPPGKKDREDGNEQGYPRRNLIEPLESCSGISHF